MMAMVFVHEITCFGWKKGLFTIYRCEQFTRIEPLNRNKGLEGRLR